MSNADLLIALKKAAQTLPNVSHVRSASAFTGIRVLVEMANGTEVSIIRHDGSYGGAQGLYEAAVFNDFGCLREPKGWLTLDDVVEYVTNYAKGA